MPDSLGILSQYNLGNELLNERISSIIVSLAFLGLIVIISYVILRSINITDSSILIFKKGPTKKGPSII